MKVKVSTLGTILAVIVLAAIAVYVIKTWYHVHYPDAVFVPSRIYAAANGTLCA